MKKHFMLVLAALMPLLTYLVATFISWEPDVRVWGSIGRNFYVLATLILSGLCITLWDINRK